MQDEDVLTQVPPTVEELDHAMGATQGDSDDDKTTPPSPSLVPKKMHFHHWYRSPTQWT